MSTLSLVLHVVHVVVLCAAITMFIRTRLALRRCQRERLAFEERAIKLLTPRPESEWDNALEMRISDVSGIYGQTTCVFTRRHKAFGKLATRVLVAQSVDASLVSTRDMAGHTAQRSLDRGVAKAMLGLSLGAER